MAHPSAELRSQISGFAQEQQDCLNRTVTQGISLNATLRGDGLTGWIGYCLRADAVADSRPIPLTVSKREPHLYLRVLHTLALDHQGKYLMVKKSVYDVCADADGIDTLFHYDYVRDNSDYPEAHLQVEGESAALDRVFDAAGRDAHASLARLHFPVGPRRYRPTLEDVIEFLVAERLVAVHDGWEEVIEEGRQRFHTKQLRAAVRRAPEPAASQLRDMGYRVDEPDS